MDKDSHVHTLFCRQCQLDSQTLYVYKGRKRVHRESANRIRARVRQHRQQLRQHRKAAQNATALRVAVCERLPVDVCFRVCLFL